MEILKRLTKANLKQNIKRTIGTTIGIILSVALICAVAGMISSFRATLIEETVQKEGYYHVMVDTVTKEDYEDFKLNRDISKIYPLYNVGYAKFTSEKEISFPFLRIYSSAKNVSEALKFEITDGNYPSSKEEIVVSKKFLKDTGLNIGDEIEYDVGKRFTLDGYELHDNNPYIENEENLKEVTKRKYKIVGIVTRQGWSDIYFGLTNGEETDNIKTFISYKNPKEYNKSTAELIKNNNKDDYPYSYNRELLRWEAFAMSDDTVTSILMVAAIVIGIIVITSIFCIRNSFAISTTEKMKMFGMLSSVGATKKQIKKSVIMEGLILASIGIPLGILSGIFADFVLIKVINLILGNGEVIGLNLVFKISLLPILISVILGYITIYLSSLSSARKASKVSPIDNLKSNNEINIKSKKLKTPKIISKIFKTGGELAYKNLKRSKRKYRTTVLSLTISIFVFISMYSFIKEGFNQSELYYKDYDYNISIFKHNGEDQTDSIEEIKKLSGVDEIYVVSHLKNYEYIKIYDMSKVNEDIEDREYMKDEDGREYKGLEVLGLDDETFKKYAKKIKANYDEVKDKGILVDEVMFYVENGESSKSVISRAYKYKKGDIIKSELSNTKKPFEIKIGEITKERPYGYENTYYSGGFIVINKDYFKDLNYITNSIYIYSKDPDELCDKIGKLNLNLSIINLEEQYRNEKAMTLVISIFLYGFITVITLIGITNIFNTITSNMELRSTEFAMLKSIGMTKKEFNRMINLETLFYSSKSLIYGTILGLIGSYAIHLAFSEKNVLKYSIPYTAILICIVAVILIVYIIMKYSISKINKQNTIETIRNENI